MEGEDVAHSLSIVEYTMEMGGVEHSYGILEYAIKGEM